jgi:hypothetical protein
MFEGMIQLRHEDQIFDYELAVEAFARSGDKATLFRSLLALEIPADMIRWHVTRPGQRRMCVAPGPRFADAPRQKFKTGARSPKTRRNHLEPIPSQTANEAG